MMKGARKARGGREAGGKHAFAYNALNQLTSVAGPDNQATAFSYDLLDRLTSTTLPAVPGVTGAFTTTMGYDILDGGLAREDETDPNGGITRRLFDPWGQMRELRQVVVPGVSSFRTFYDYFPGGLLQRVTDANGNAMAFAYDGMDRLVQKTDFNGGAWQYTYYLDGLLKTQTDPKGQVIEFLYDNLGRVTRKNYVTSGSKRIEYVYADGGKGQNISEIREFDAGGNLVRATSFAYDNSFRFVSMSVPEGTLTYTYNVADRITSYTIDNDPSTKVSFLYYDGGSVASIQRAGDNPVLYTYLLTGQQDVITYPDGSTVDRDYDAHGRMAMITNRDSFGNVISSYAYGYDFNHAMATFNRKGQRVSETDHTGAQRKFYYDTLYRLTRVDYPDIADGTYAVDIDNTSWEWSYDAIGNRLTQVITDHKNAGAQAVRNYVYYLNAAGKAKHLLQSDGEKDYVWDDNGNLDHTLLAGTSTVLEDFAWDEENRLASLVTPTESVAFGYDYQGTLVFVSTAAQATTYLHRGADAVKASVNGASAYYVHGPAIDDWLSNFCAAGAEHYFKDNLRSVKAVAQDGGNVVQTYDYDAWGSSALETGTSVNPFQYAGRERVAEDYYNNRTRTYSPPLAKFLSQDMIGIEGGINQYRYVGNNPISYFDPYGLARVCARRVMLSKFEQFLYVGLGKNNVPYHLWIENQAHTYSLSYGNTQGELDYGPDRNPPETPICGPEIPSTCDCHDEAMKIMPLCALTSSYKASTGPNSNTFARCMAEHCGLTDLPGVANNDDAPGWDAGRIP